MSRSSAHRSRRQDASGHNSRFKTKLAHILSWLPAWNFITIHYAYFIVVPLVTSLIFWGSSDPKYSISYVDSLFLVVSAMTEAGLNTVNLSQMTTWQQVLLWLLIIVGSTIWVSIWTVFARKHVFEQRFEEIVAGERDRRVRRRASKKRDLMLGRILTLGKAKSEPALQTGLPGFGTRQNAEELRALDTVGGRSFGSLSLQGQAAYTEPEDAISPATKQEPETIFPTDHIAFADSSAANARTTSVYHRHVALNRSATQTSVTSAESEHEESHPFHWRNILNSRNVGRNAQFHDLSTEERDRLGGCEYRALKLLSIVVPLYSFLWQFLGAIAVGAWIANNKSIVATSNGANPWWAGIFFAVSAFNNSGMALLDANMIPFQQAHFVLITMGLLILAGNTAYPLFLRLIFWAFLKVLKLTTAETAFCGAKSTLEFILKYPRRVYTNLFPSRPTWWLFFMLLLTNITDWVAFEVMNIGNPAIEAIPLGPRVLDGLFQALAVRSGGFYVIPISTAYIGLQVLYVIMMYISVYPVVITMRHSNVYEERSLGIYADDPPVKNEEVRESLLGMPQQRQGAVISAAIKRHFSLQGVGVNPHPQQQPGEETPVSFISQQIRGQLAHDLWWLVIAVLAIVTIETGNFLTDPVTFSVFNVVFEVVSAYGCCGISVGLPTAAYSFSGGWTSGSKLVLCLVMLRGRHRGLPVALDRAVRLPGQQLNRDEEEDHRLRRARTAGRSSMDV